MKINAQMNLSELAQHMGSAATQSDARDLRELLVASGYTDTADISDMEWGELLESVLPKDFGPHN